MMNIKDYFKKKARLSVEPKRIDKITFNEPDAYATMDANIDLVHGCVIADAIADVIGDVVVDGVVDGVGDAVADSVADSAADAAADSAADAGADGGGDGGDGGDGGGDGGVPEGSTSATANLGRIAAGVIGATAVSMITVQVTNALQGLGSGTTSAEYYTALYNSMIQYYPCNVASTSACPGTQRSEQEYMIYQYQTQLINNSASDAQAAQTFWNTWGTSSSEVDLKNTLGNMTETTGIPSLIQYMESYTNSGASGAALVIATLNTVASVVSFEYTD